MSLNEERFRVEHSNMRDNDHKALEMMKALEKKKRRQLKPIRVDERTVHYATKGRIEEIREYYKLKK